MTRHIVDHIQDNGAGRTRNFARQERETGTHPAVEALRMRPRARSASGNRRAVEFTRIERGRRV
jgi:hypothetical protein